MNPLTADCFLKTTVFWLLIPEQMQPNCQKYCLQNMLTLQFSLSKGSLIPPCHSPMPFPHAIPPLTALIKLQNTPSISDSGFSYTKDHYPYTLMFTFARASIFSLFRARFGGRARTMLVLVLCLCYFRLGVKDFMYVVMVCGLCISPLSHKAPGYQKEFP